tara:strand:- start:2737 stop:2850 length:114 start_codon:yes stop_codon:yes gene_type:complete
MDDNQEQKDSDEVTDEEWRDLCNKLSEVLTKEFFNFS